LAQGPAKRLLDATLLLKDRHPSTIEAMYLLRGELPPPVKRDFLEYALKLHETDKIAGRYQAVAMKLVFQLEPFDFDTFKLFEDKLEPAQKENGDQWARFSKFHKTEELTNIGGAQILANLSGVPIQYGEHLIMPHPAAMESGRPSAIEIENLPVLAAELQGDGMIKANPQAVGSAESSARKEILERIKKRNNVDPLYAFIKSHTISASLPIEFLAEDDNYSKNEETLFPLCGDATRRDAVFRTLARLQLRRPDPRLADCYIKYGKDVGGNAQLEVITALWARRSGRWGIALVSSLQYLHNNLYPPALIYNARDNLPADALNLLRRHFAGSANHDSSHTTWGEDKAVTLLRTWAQKTK
jgi:hypothetical protein